MRRRQIVAGGLATIALSRTAPAQRATRPRRIGFMAGGDPSLNSLYQGFQQGMQSLGWREGTDLVIEWRYAHGRYERFTEFATELLGRGVDAFVVSVGAAVLPLRRVSATVPIVIGYSIDPVGNGFVASLARPGGNVTGLASSADDTTPKQFELLVSVVPGLSHVGMLLNPGASSAVMAEKAAESARTVGITLTIERVTRADQIDGAVTNLAAAGARAVIVAPDALFIVERTRLAALMLRHRLPAIFALREYAVAGGLMSYGDDLRAFYRRSATYVDKILKGARPEDLPVEQPTHFHLVINRKTADALGLEIPMHVLVFANEVIE